MDVRASLYFSVKRSRKTASASSQWNVPLCVPITSGFVSSVLAFFAGGWPSTEIEFESDTEIGPALRPGAETSVVAEDAIDRDWDLAIASTR